MQEASRSVDDREFRLGLARYSLEDLGSIALNIDRVKYPGKYKAVLQELKRKRRRNQASHKEKKIPFLSRDRNSSGSRLVAWMFKSLFILASLAMFILIIHTWGRSSPPQDALIGATGSISELGYHRKKVRMRRWSTHEYYVSFHMDGGGQRFTYHVEQDNFERIRETLVVSDTLTFVYFMDGVPEVPYIIDMKRGLEVLTTRDDFRRIERWRSFWFFLIGLGLGGFTWLLFWVDSRQ